MIFEVIAACTPDMTNCNHAPHFSPKTPKEFHQAVCDCEPKPSCDFCPFFKGTEKTVYINAVDYDTNEIVSLQYGALPRGSRVDLVSRTTKTDPYDNAYPNRVKAWSVYSLTWFPQLEDVDGIVCVQAIDDNPTQPKLSFNKYCIEMKLEDRPSIYVSGILRDFKTDHVDFGRSETNADDTVQWVESTLDAAGKPQKKASPATNSVRSFNDWFNSNPAVNKETVFSTRLLQMDMTLDRYTYARPFDLGDSVRGNTDTRGTPFFLCFCRGTHFTHP
jgi:hypothetical protein